MEEVAQGGWNAGSEPLQALIPGTLAINVDVAFVDSGREVVASCCVVVSAYHAKE